MVVAFDPSTWEADAGESLSLSEFQDSQGNIEKPCFEKPKEQNQKQNTYPHK